MCTVQVHCCAEGITAPCIYQSFLGVIAAKLVKRIQQLRKTPSYVNVEIELS